MSPPGRQNGPRELPIGRRVAQLRNRRGMTQQVFADRIGKSKSWVDKVERGVRTLDRLPMIEAVAAALGVAPAVLLGRRFPRTPAAGTTAAVERVREALASYDTPTGRGWPSSVAELDRQTRYAQTAYRHAHHAQVLRMLPGLLAAARHAHRPPVAAADAWPAGPILVRVYRLTAHLLVKLGEPQLAWFAADRAIGTAAADPRHTAYAAVALAQALRALNRGRLALAAATTAVRGIDPTPDHDPPPDGLALAGTLLTEAAVAAATCGEAATADDLTERAARLAARHAGRQHRDDDGFGPVVVDLARALVAARLGDHQTALTRHQAATRENAWHQLPAEHRAAHLIDVSRVLLDVGDHPAAGRALVTADRIAPAEVRLRPAAHTVLTAVLRAGPTPADVTRLATTIGLTRQP